MRPYFSGVGYVLGTRDWGDVICKFCQTTVKRLSKKQITCGGRECRLLRQKETDEAAEARTLARKGKTCQS